MTIAVRSFFQPPIGVPVSIANSQPNGWTGELLTQAKPDWWALSKFREDGDWDDYSKRYLRLLNDRSTPILSAVQNLIDSYGSATFCCWCKDPDTCHRSLFGQWLETQGWAVDRG